MKSGPTNNRDEAVNPSAAPAQNPAPSRTPSSSTITPTSTTPPAATSSSSPAPAPAPAGKYIPPALRKRMEEEQQRAHQTRSFAPQPPERSPSVADYSDGRRFSDYPEGDLHRSFDSVGDFRRFRDDAPPSRSPPPMQAFDRRSSWAGDRGNMGRSGGMHGGGGGGGGGTYDRWRRFHDSRHDADRAAKREEWLKAHAEEIHGLEAAMEAEDDPYADMTVDVTGNGAVEKPLDRFTDIDLGEALDSNILRAKYVRPMPVQSAALPIIISGRDLMACAQTGSGKTAAFLLPVISNILLNGPPPPPPPQRGTRQKAYPQALIMAPTRELASQIFDEAQKFAFGSPVRAVVVYGGADVIFQMRDLERGCDILVATPGRLVDLMERVRVSLSCIRYLILDEADRMLDMGFEPQIRHIVEKEDMTPLDSRQTLMFSATFPKEIQRLAQDFLRDYLFLTVGRVGSTVSNIIQRLVYARDEHEKRSAVVDLLNTHRGLTLVFVETKRAADSLEAYLCDQGLSVTSIHGDRTQQEREAALRSFRDHRTTVLVATDVAARGLDIPNVLHVINYDLPTELDSYVHRIGRTGRARKTGLATAFISEKNKPILRELHDLLTETNQDIPDWFEDLTRSAGAFGGYGGGRRGRGGRGGRGRSFDMRREHGGSGFGGSGYGGGQRRGSAQPAQSGGWGDYGDAGGGNW